MLSCGRESEECLVLASQSLPQVPTGWHNHSVAVCLFVSVCRAQFSVTGRFFPKQNLISALQAKEGTWPRFRLFNLSPSSCPHFGPVFNNPRQLADLILTSTSPSEIFPRRHHGRLEQKEQERHQTASFPSPSSAAAQRLGRHCLSSPSSGQAHHC